MDGNNKFIKQLIQECQSALTSKPIEKVVFQGNEILDEPRLKYFKKSIYIIRMFDGDPDLVFQQMRLYKDKKDRKCPRLNEPSSVLYVGSSITNLTNRLKQHLGYGPKATYSLHLRHWFTNDFSTEVLRYEDSLERSVLQILEDSLSYDLQPAFGKTGGNGR